jgi:hypothetical protein
MSADRTPSVAPARRAAALLLLLVLGAPAGAAAQAGRVDLDTVRAGRYDAGRMWTFEHAPARLFSETYGFQADSAWFARARLAALRVPGCSAAFVSPNGLVATNHHCIRGAMTRTQQAGENLLDTGYFARSLQEERRIPDYHVDQLIAIRDVSDELFRAEDAQPDDAGRLRARQAAFAAIQERLRTEYQQAGALTVVQIVPLYHGGRFSAYVFRRYPDVRLVAAPELQLGYFGGDADNFTYPRYALDFAFLRVYGADGQPVRPSHHFTFSRTGVREGEPVFVIGNPGATNRLLTVAQLEFLRDVQVPAMLDFLGSRLVAMRGFLERDREAAEAVNLRNRIFSLSNVEKSTGGRMAALEDPVIMARRADAERTLRAEIEARPVLRARWGAVIDTIAAVQAEKRRLAPPYAAFHRLGDVSAESATMRRALLAATLTAAQQAGAPADTLAAIQGRLLAVAAHPAPLERSLLEARLRDFGRSLGADHPLARAALGGRSAEEAASAILAQSVLADSARLAAALLAGGIPATVAGGVAPADPGLALAQQLGPAFFDYGARWSAIAAREARLLEQLGRARFAIHGADLPPDGTSSPRITDGVVLRYPFNGTMAPYHTTFHGMYDRFHAFGPDSDWALPPGWTTPPPRLQLGTPLNFVSTADTFGGNSGSPAVTRDLELVGLNFDRNIEGLSRDYIYLPARGRNIMVDVRAIRASLADVYDLHRVVLELETGTLYRDEPTPRRGPPPADLRHHQPPRRGEDDAHREAAAVRRRDPPGRQRQGAPRRAPRDLRLDEARAGARHLGDLERHAVRVSGQAGQPARHAGPRRLLGRHLPHADRRRQRGHAARQPQGRRGAHAAALRGLPPPATADLHLRQQVRPPRRRPAAAARRRGEGPRHPLLPDHLADHPDGNTFLGVYDRLKREIHLFEKDEHHGAAACRAGRLARRPGGAELLGERRTRSCSEQIELLDMAGEEFSREAFLAGELSPTFFGSALTNFGVEPFLHVFLETWRPRRARARRTRAGRAGAGGLHRLRLQDPGEHGPEAPRPDRLRARRLGPLRGGHAGEARPHRQDDPPLRAADSSSRRSARTSRRPTPAT